MMPSAVVNEVGGGLVVQHGLGDWGEVGKDDERVGEGATRGIRGGH